MKVICWSNVPWKKFEWIKLNDFCRRLLERCHIGRVDHSKTTIGIRGATPHEPARGYRWICKDIHGLMVYKGKQDGPDGVRHNHNRDGRRKSEDRRGALGHGGEDLQLCIRPAVICKVVGCCSPVRTAGPGAGHCGGRSSGLLRATFLRQMPQFPSRTPTSPLRSPCKVGAPNSTFSSSGPADSPPPSRAVNSRRQGNPRGPFTFKAHHYTTPSHHIFTVLFFT
ncbi:hypothetical protein QBC45DRAFT_176305 [Copromyces sp. CBS 386.78]|nr:hypothetical protein QBC45DRAFT_176305 [Copromyces sp. CBS 386.78]